MHLISRIEELRSWLASTRPGKSVGFVPTMGYLHAGHQSLIRQASIENDLVVVSIFVNPTQFGPGEDFQSYPRDLERDLDLAEQAGATLVLHPSAEQMYPSGATSYVEVAGRLTQPLCAQSRPTHFRGVTTVVAKLFNLVQPDRAYFGQKDAQQAIVIRQMTRDLLWPIAIEVCPIVRETDGLAMSSRNVRLSPEARQQASVLWRGLQAAQSAVGLGEHRVEKLERVIRSEISKANLASIDYIEILDAQSLETVSVIAENQSVLAAVAVRFGDVRLIDNIILTRQGV